MTSITKFVFENSFDAVEQAAHGAVEEEAPPPEPTFSEAELSAARRSGFEEGHKAGATEVLQSIENTVAQALGAISDQLSSIAPQYGLTLNRSRAESIDIARAITRKMLADQAVDAILPSIESVITSILPRLMDEPRIVIRVSDSLLDPLQERLPAMTERCGFPGSLILLAEPALTGPDCRIEWADGGAEHDSGSLWSEIDNLIERYVAGIGLDEDSATSEAGDVAPNPTGDMKSEEYQNG